MAHLGLGRRPTIPAARPLATIAAALAVVILGAATPAERDAAPVERDGAVTTTRPTGPEVTIVFAASDGSGSHCQRADNAGCGLYRARYDLGGHQVLAVDPLVDTPGEAEWFPAVDPTGTMVLFERRVDRHGRIEHLDLASGALTPVGPGRYPDFDHQGHRFAYSTERWELMVAPYETDRAGWHAGEPEPVGPGRDPQFLPDGQRLIFHHRPAGETTRTMLQDLTTRRREDFSEPDRCAHAAVNHDGSVGICGARGTVWARQRQDDGGWGPITALAEPREPADYGPRFTLCRRVSYGYAEFCGDDRHLVVTAHCGADGEPWFANLVLIDLDDGEVIDLHGQLEAARGVHGTHSATAACVPLAP